MPPVSSRPLDVLFTPASLVAVVVAGEALAALLALSPALMDDRLVVFGLMSLGIQWTTLGTLALLYPFRHWLGRLHPQRLAWICLAALLLVTVLVAVISWHLPGFQPATTDGGTPFLLRALAVAAVAGTSALLVFQNHWRNRQLAVRAKLMLFAVPMSIGGANNIT